MPVVTYSFCFFYVSTLASFNFEEFQIDRMFQAKKVDEDILNTALNEMSNSPMHFEIDKVVFMMVRLHRLKELVKLL